VVQCEDQMVRLIRPSSSSVARSRRRRDGRRSAEVSGPPQSQSRSRRQTVR